ncbi:GNAT family N-acetyltransferase [Pseudonocardia endophytica]|uniref:Ribosomal protein S18 acetylase RimI-like enzyme n=1 Tax=Pseudonocardia endophytica TaxID=401976 RepID=A0A4R1HW50_PSEEN|nr:GNAT family N-acetyltransferase [Pseudonocardia endophytica]TCK26548.1 ribosomal protein S18 acetylase RimI-like enzyme [Pseudonocardia endophytica]
MIVLRELTVDDWEHWKEMRLAALAEAPYAFHTRIEDWVGATEERWRSRLDVPGRFLLADLDGHRAGICCGLPPDPLGVADLLSLWVAPFARGRGVSDALVTAVCDWARDLGADRVALHVVEGNAPASGLYLRHGFVDMGPVPGTAVGGRPEHRMERVLTRRAPLPEAEHH